MYFTLRPKIPERAPMDTQNLTFRTQRSCCYKKIFLKQNWENFYKNVREEKKLLIPPPAKSQLHQSCVHKDVHSSLGFLLLISDQILSFRAFSKTFKTKKKISRQPWTKSFWIFSSFRTISFYHKWNGTRLSQS